MGLLLDLHLGSPWEIGIELGMQVQNPEERFCL